MPFSQGRNNTCAAPNAGQRPHLKNFSLLQDGVVRTRRLAPAYDLLSTRLVIPEKDAPEEMALTCFATIRNPQKRQEEQAEVRGLCQLCQKHRAQCKTVSDSLRPACSKPACPVRSCAKKLSAAQKGLRKTSGGAGHKAWAFVRFRGHVRHASPGTTQGQGQSESQATHRPEISGRQTGQHCPCPWPSWQGDATLARRGPRHSLWRY